MLVSGGLLGYEDDRIVTLSSSSHVNEVIWEWAGEKVNRLQCDGLLSFETAAS